MDYDKIIAEINSLMDACIAEDRKHLDRYYEKSTGPFANYHREKHSQLEVRYLALGECRKIVEKYAKEE